MLKKGQKVKRLPGNGASGATVLFIENENVLLAYDEGGQGWWPLSALEYTPIVSDWITFKSALLLDPNNPNPSSSAVNQSLVTAFPITTAAVLGLSAALAKAEMGDPTDFALCWRAVQAAAPLPANILANLLALGQTCNLPSDFIAIFQPSPSNNNSGGGGNIKPVKSPK